MGENFANDVSKKGLIIKVYKQLYSSTSKKQTTQSKNGHEI